MKKFIPIFILIALGLLLSGCASSESYRYQGAGRSWSINIDKQRPRYGESCVRFELRHGDYWSYASSFRGWTKSHRTERMMLHQAMQGQVYWYGFSMMIPIESSDPQAMTKVGQWHQGTSSGDSPAAEQEWQEKKLSIRIGWETKEVLQFKKGKWFDFVYQFKFGPDGYANVWINGEKFMEFGGTIGTPVPNPISNTGSIAPTS